MATRLLRYLSHPQVLIDPNVPVPEWGLSDIGRHRVDAIKNCAALKHATLIASSAERKAIETAGLIGEALTVRVTVIAAAHENDRSATGFLPPPEFDRVANQFFAHPEASVRGWERAIDAQSRIVGVLESVVATNTAGDILMVGHGGVGTLLYCHCARLAISRSHDQMAGGGCFWTMELGSRTVLHGWKPMEYLCT